MNVLRNLTGAVYKEEIIPGRAPAATHDEPTPGLVRQAQLGKTGLLLFSGSIGAFVPSEELFKLLESTDGRVGVLVPMPREFAAGLPRGIGGCRP